MTNTPEDTELREMLELNAETIETDDGEYLAVDIDRAMNLITQHTKEAYKKGGLKAVDMVGNDMGWEESADNYQEMWLKQLKENK